MNRSHYLEFIERLGYDFRDKQLLERALTHRSFSSSHNERMEFLGDSVLGLVISNLLYKSFPDTDEGLLSRWRSTLVCQTNLAKVAGILKLGSVLRLGEGEIKNGGAERPSTLADALEAVLGAVYLDGGIIVVESIVGRLFNLYDKDIKNASAKDPKTRLQEYLQARQLARPDYVLLDAAGLPHEHVFTVACMVPSLNLESKGISSSRRGAEQEAAQSILDRLESA